MRKNIFGRQFSRDTNQRRSLFKNLITSLILQESIKTTLEKAKAIKGDVDKIINRAKRGDESQAVRFLKRSLGVDAVNKVIKDLLPRLNNRTGGYTRIIKLGRRFSDNAAMVVMEWVVKKDKISKIKDQKEGTKELPAGKPAITEAQRKAKAQKKTKRKAVKK